MDVSGMLQLASGVDVPDELRGTYLRLGAD